MKRIFVIADLKCGKSQAAFIDEQRVIKGLIRNGCDVQTFSYRDVMDQCNPLSGKPFRRILAGSARAAAEELLHKQIKHYYPDIVYFMTIKHIMPQTVAIARDAAPNAFFVGRDGDPYPDSKPGQVDIGALMDLMIMPSGGKFLQVYKDAGTPKCAFLPFTSDSELHQAYPAEPQWETDLVFLGAAKHRRLKHDPDRYEIARRLSEMPNAKLFGCFDQPKTAGLDCFKAISSAKIGISLNIANDVYLYHSDRFINIPACGSFELAKRVPGYDLMFEEGRHLRYFDSVEECFELAEYYLKNEQERNRLRIAGMEQAHREFNYTRIAGLLLELIKTGDYDAAWKCVL